MSVLKALSSRHKRDDDAKYWLTADFFDFLQADNPWRAKGSALNVLHVVEDAKHSSSGEKMQKKLQWLVEEMRRVAEVPTEVGCSIGW